MPLKIIVFQGFIPGLLVLKTLKILICIVVVPTFSNYKRLSPRNVHYASDLVCV